MNNMNPVMKILVENATTYSDRNKIFSLMEAEANNVNNTMISNLYNAAIEKAHVDFEDIPQSKGDLTKYSGYQSMISSLSLIREIMSKSNVKIDDVVIVENAISNITAYRDQFEKGFKLEKEFIILQYNVLVAACVESVSTLISSYVDYVKRPDKIEFTIIKQKNSTGWISISNLDKFNQSVKTGDFSKVLNTVINSGHEGFVGVDDIVVPIVIIGGVSILVPLIRELIFHFYYSRMKISDFLKVQATFLEMNKANVEVNSGIPVKKRNEILKKQAESIKTLNSWADKIKVNYTMTQNKSNGEIDKQNKNWTIDNIQSQAASTDQNGFKLL